jgi:hypothetical protein
VCPAFVVGDAPALDHDKLLTEVARGASKNTRASGGIVLFTSSGRKRAKERVRVVPGIGPVTQCPSGIILSKSKR